MPNSKPIPPWMQKAKFTKDPKYTGKKVIKAAAKGSTFLTAEDGSKVPPDYYKNDNSKRKIMDAAKTLRNTVGTRVKPSFITSNTDGKNDIQTRANKIWAGRDKIEAKHIDIPGKSTGNQKLSEFMKAASIKRNQNRKVK